MMGHEDITKLDKNFCGENVEYEGLKIINIKDPKSKIKIYGLYKPYEQSRFKRMNPEATTGLSDNIQRLIYHTSGGRIRFRTNSSRIFLRSILSKMTDFIHMPRTGSSCFDLYVDGEYINNFQHGLLQNIEQSTEKTENAYDSNITLGDKRMRDVLIHFPLYNRVENVFIGLDEDAEILESEEYTYTKPIVFYGSSITQGGCASHPGNAYPNLIARRFDTDILNMGFSDGCRAEIPMLEYLANLDMSILVYDYDHNAGTAEFLAETHEAGFQYIRKRRPELPIIMVSAADRLFCNPERRDIVKATYEHAISAGDQNVYFLDGHDIYAPVGRDFCTVDMSHANDLGFYLMGKAIGDIIETILVKR
jgi:hypothetical protein